MKKLMLVDPSQINPNLTYQRERAKPFGKRETDRLDRAMLAIIDDTTMTQDEKVAAYTSALDRYQTAGQTYLSSPPQSFGLKQANPTTTTAKEIEYDPLIGLTKQFLPRAKKLLALLQKNNALTVSDNGEVVIEGSKLAGSNISDLLNASVNPKANVERVVGIKEFTELLDKTNVPQTLISDKLKVPKISAPYDSSPFATPTVGAATQSKQFETFYSPNWEAYDSPRYHDTRTKKARKERQNY